MNQLPAAIQKAVRKNEPIEMDGLTFYPILVSEMDDFNEARSAIELMQQSLPVTYAVMPMLQALYALDTDALRDTGHKTGLFARAVLFLALSLRLGQGMTWKERMDLFQICPAQDVPGKLLSVKFLYNGEGTREITPAQFSRYRPILAAQNGLLIPDETANKDLIEAEKNMDDNPLNIVPSFDKMLAGVAMREHCHKSDLLDWTICEFMERFKAIGQELGYLVCAISEGNGCKWTGGNPIPHWCLDRQQSNKALIPISQFAAGAGSAATQKDSP